MFFEYTSNSIINLSDKFLDILSKNSPLDPFSKNWIIVQNNEMQQWIKLQEASKRSISANNEFILPSEFLWKLYRLHRPELPKNLPSDRLPMQVSIFEILNNDNYLVREITGKESLDPKLLLQLSTSISDVFDLYQVFRPKLIQKWEENKLNYHSKHEIWQAKLWRKLSDFWATKEEVVTRVDAFNSLEEWISVGSFPFNKLPDKIWIFSLPHYSKPFADIISLLANKIDVHDFGYAYEKVINTSDDNSFSKSLLKTHLDNKLVVDDSLQSAGGDVQEVPIPEENFESSSLKKIQGILQNRITTDTGQGDKTLQIHSCYNIRREAELLKDKLLKAFNEDPELKPEECMILVPKIDEYKNILIDVLSEAVNEPNIPLGKAFEDRSQLPKNTFLELLSVLNSDFKVNSVLEFINNPIISDKWKFSEDEQKIIRKWAVDLHVHRGVNDSVFSWLTGLDRLFFGYAMESDSFKLVEGKSVYSKFLNSESLALLAKLSSFISNLKDHISSLQGANTFSDWLRKMVVLAENFLLKEYDGEFQVKSLISRLQELQAKTDTVDINHTISFELFSIWLKKQFKESNSATVSFGHGVNLSEYVPNRNIPYKFVAILGLNDKVLPSPVLRPDYDLIHRHPIPGDRIEKQEQRYLFFDMIHSAEEKLHISYLGQNSQSIVESMPSVLLQELIETCKASGISLSIQKHRLHGFEKEYFNKNNADLISFSDRRKMLTKFIYENEPEIDNLFEQDLTFPEQANKFDISLSELISFFTDPPKTLCREKLGISNYDDFNDPSDRELFETKMLDKYFLKDFLQESLFENVDFEQIRSASKSKGLVPEGYPGEIDFNTNLMLINKLNLVREKYDLHTKTRIEIDSGSALKPYTLNGIVSNVFEDSYVEIRLGSLKGKNVLKLWLNHISLNLGADFNSELFYFEKEELKSLKINEETISSKDELIRLIEFYHKALDQPASQVYPVESSFEFAKTHFKTGSDKEAIKKAYETWDGWGEFSESDSYYNSLMYSDIDFIESESFQMSSKELWLPILKAIGDLS
jgi:exodeoxyribonuclease V gamma subunit